jgi:hypothetical protein
VGNLNKSELLTEKRALREWVSSLVYMDDQLWFQPFREGKWATADVISHFITWDRFFLDHRLPYIEKQIAFPKLDVNVEKMNKDAVVYARSGISKHRVVNEYTQTRNLLLSILEEWPEGLFSSVIKVGSTEQKVGEYFYSHLEHDIKHQQKIIDFLEKHSK